MPTVGKRQFMLQASKYLKKVESTGQPLTITHQNRPCLRVIPITSKKISDLRGIIKKYRGKKDINKPILPGYDRW